MLCDPECYKAWDNCPQMRELRLVALQSPLEGHTPSGLEFSLASNPMPIRGCQPRGWFPITVAKLIVGIVHILKQVSLKILGFPYAEEHIPTSCW